MRHIYYIVFVAIILCSCNAFAKDDYFYIEVVGGTKTLFNVLGIKEHSLSNDPIYTLSNYLTHDIIITNNTSSESKKYALQLYFNYMNKATQIMTPANNKYITKLNITTEDNKKYTEKFLNLFGYKLEYKNNTIYAKVSDNKENWQKHITLSLLGYPIERIISQLQEGKEIEIIIPVDYVLVPIPLSIIEKMTRPSYNISKNFLSMIAENINLSFMILSLYNLDPTTINIIDKFHSNSKLSSWRRLLLSSEIAGWAFYKISPYLQANSETIYTPLSREYINGTIGLYFNEYSFIKNWMSNSDGKLAYFMRSLFEFNPDLIPIIFNPKKEKIDKDINLLYYSISLPSIEKLSSFYDLKQLDGFPELARSLKIKDEDIYFPGGYQNWLLAIKSSNIPKNRQELLTEASKEVSNIDYITFFKELSKYKIEANEFEYSGINILFYVYNFFVHKPELATKENIILLFRNYPYFPELLSFIDTIRFNEPSLLTNLIFHMHELEKYPNSFYEPNMMIFQSTLGLFSILSLNNNIKTEEINSIFSSFLDIPLDNYRKYGLNFVNWFCSSLFTNHTCQDISSSSILDILLANIPNDKINLGNVNYIYGAKNKKKMDMLLVMNSQKIPEPELLISAAHLINEKSKLLTEKDIANHKKQLEQYAFDNKDSTHPINKAVSSLISFINSLDTKQTLPDDVFISFNKMLGCYLLSINYAYWLSNPNNPAYKDEQFVAKHDIEKLKTTILIKYPWKNTKLVSQDPKKGMYIQGSVALLPVYLAYLHMLNEPFPPNTRILNSELSKWIIYSSLIPSWNLIDDNANSFVANLYLLGIDIINSLNSKSLTSSDLNLLKKIVGKPRLNRILNCLNKSANDNKLNCQPILNYFAPSDLFFIGKYYIDNNIKFNAASYKTLMNIKKNDPQIDIKISQFGYSAPSIIGTSLLSIDMLPSYEKLERYYTHAPIAQRFFDHKIKISYLLYKLKLPSSLLYDLWYKNSLYILSHLYQNYIDDWEPLIELAETTNKQMINRWLQELKAQGTLELE